MELVAPLSAVWFAWPRLSWMLALFVLHYVNRAVVQPLCSPTRSPLHAVVVLSAVVFNLMNGYLLGTWLRGVGEAPMPGWYTSVGVALGILMYAGGLAGNVWHDQVLLALRRTPRDGASVRTASSDYRIPYGGLYRWISYPNYLCECRCAAAHAGIEWSGWALCCLCTLPHARAPLVSQAPVLFVLIEIAVMLPRAVRGHRWYHAQFGTTPRGAYPAERRAVVPFLV